MNRKTNTHADVIVGFEAGWPKRIERQVQSDGRGLHIFHKGKFAKVAFGKSGYILERLLKA